MAFCQNLTIPKNQKPKQTKTEENLKQMDNCKVGANLDKTTLKPKIPFLIHRAKVSD